jgi:site-specific recombinase XerD
MGRSPNTERAYRSDWADFVRWCTNEGEVALPARPDTVVRYLHELATTRKASTVQRRLAAIAEAHRGAGIGSPTTADEVRVAATRIQWRQRKGAGKTVPLEKRQLEQILAVLPAGLIGLRDRALLLVSYGAGLRPSEVVALDVSDATIVDAGLAVSLLRGRIVIPYGSTDELCAVRAWHRWAAAAGVTNGPAFRAVDRHGHLGIRRLSEKSVTRIVRRAAERAGLDESRYSALSLRLGMVSTATEVGAPDTGIMHQTGLRSRPLVRRYMRETQEH